MTTKRYWVSSVDGEPIGEYGGFQFDTRGEAEAFIDTTYDDELRLLEDGYYESRSELQKLKIEELEVLGSVEYVIPKARRNR